MTQFKLFFGMVLAVHGFSLQAQAQQIKVSSPQTHLPAAVCQQEAERALLGVHEYAYPTYAESMARPQQSWITTLYQSNDHHRAESALLRILYTYPKHSSAQLATLVRAKLYYKEKRYDKSNIEMISLLDQLRHHHPISIKEPGKPFLNACIYQQATHLLVLGLMRQKRWQEAYQQANDFSEVNVAPFKVDAIINSLKAPPQANISAEKARLWSSIVPGAGYFVIDEPFLGMMTFAATLTAFGGAYTTYQNHDNTASIVLGLLGLGFHLGGRQGTYELAVQKHTQRTQKHTDKVLKPVEIPVLSFSFFS